MASKIILKLTAGSLMITIFLFLLLTGISGATPDVAYVAGSSNNAISVIDTNINKIMASTSISSPEDMVVAANGTKLFTTDKSGNLLRWMDTTYTSSSSYLAVSSPEALAASPSGEYLYVASSASDKVFAIGTDGNSNQYHIVSTDAPEVLAVKSDNTELYAASASNNTLSIISLDTDTVTDVIGIIAPDDLEAGPDGKIYAASNVNNTISVVDPGTGSILTVINITSPKGMDLSPDGAKLYVANMDADTVSVIDTSSGTITDTISVGDAPCSVSLSTDGSKLYVANSGSSTVSVISLSDNTVAATITLTYTPSEILVAPAPSNVPFRMNVNSFWFPNFYGTEYTTTDFTNTYGAYDLSDPDTKVARFYNDFFRYTAVNGTCFGMTASPLPLYNQRLGIWGYDRTDSVPANWTWAVSIPGSYPMSTVQDWVEFYQPLQYDKAVIADLATYNNLQVNYQELKQRLSSDWRAAPMLMGFSCQIWDDDTGTWLDTGHTVIPYRITESSDGKTARIDVYEPNHPYGALNYTDSERYMTIDLVNWSMRDYEMMKNVQNVQLVSLDAILAPPELPDDVISLTGEFNAAHLLFTGDTGGYLGEMKGVSYNDISGACPLISYGTASDGMPIRAYYVPSSLGVKKELIGDSDGIATVSMLQSDGLVSIDASVAPGSIGQFETSAGGSGVSFTSESGTPYLSMMVSSEGTGSDRVARVDTSNIEAGGSISLSDVDGNIKIVNEGAPHTCTLHLKQTGNEANAIDDIVVEAEADTTLIVAPTDWNDISTGVTVEHDVGSDGVVDSSGNYDPSAILVINDFTADVTSGVAPLTVTLTSDVSGGADKYQWNFGPSSTEISDIGTIVHTFKKPGTYNVTLTVKDKDGHIVDDLPKEAYIVVV